MERIGFVGLGTMGASMAANLLRAGAPLTVWNRTPGRDGPLLEMGAQSAESAAAVAARSDVIVICVSDTPDVEAVLFGPAGIAEGAARGEPGRRLLHDLARRHARLRARGWPSGESAMVDAPGLGRLGGGPARAR